MGARRRFRVVIVGGGVAALEAVWALAHLASDLIDVVVIAPNTEFSDTPRPIWEPFAYPRARRYRVPEVVHAADAEIVRGELTTIDRFTQTVHTTNDQMLQYDALLLALGAKAVPRYRHALTIGEVRFDESFRRLLRDVEHGYTGRVAFVSPGRMETPLPLYDLAIMTAARARDAKASPSITIVTPEDAPLAVLGSTVSSAVSALLSRARIGTITSAYVEIPTSGHVVVNPDDRRLRVDHVVALPELYGPPLRGIPLAENGFVGVDQHQRVPNAGPVYAAGDITQFAIKDRALASAQADTAAESIAALAGASVAPKAFHPVVRGSLLTGQRPLYFSADVTGGHGPSSCVSDRPMWSSRTNVVAKYLAPALERFDAPGHHDQTLLRR
jgi:sulfide:quinone oxidoreductase